VLFILGLCALIAPLIVAPQIIRQEVPIMIGASLLLLALSLDGGLGRIDGALLFCLIVIYTVFLIRQSRKTDQATQDEYAHEVGRASVAQWDRHWLVQLLLIVGGLVLLVLGASWLVEAAVAFARDVGVSEMVIGLTIVAAGTSLPEVATSVVATLRGERDIAVGNVIGSGLALFYGVGIAFSNVLATTAASTGLWVYPSILFPLSLGLRVAAALHVWRVIQRLALNEKKPWWSRPTLLVISYVLGYIGLVQVNNHVVESLRGLSAASTAKTWVGASTNYLSCTRMKVRAARLRFQ